MPRLTANPGDYKIRGARRRLIVTRVAETWQFYAFVFAALVR
jgi:hypothetical protein